MISRLKIRHRLWLLIALTWGILTAVAGYSLLIQKDGLLKAHEVKTYNTLELAHGVLEYYAGLVAAGALPLAAAQEAAKNTVAGMRYDGSNYYSVYDLDYRMVKHPIMPEMNGQDLSDLRDSNGVKIVVELVEAAKRGHGEFVHYLWPKPGNDTPVHKMATSLLFEPWGWILQSGIYLDDVEAEFKRQLMIYGSVIAVSMGLLLVVSLQIARSISQPLQKLQATVGEIAARGTLADPAAPALTAGRERLTVQSEIIALTEAFQAMIERLASADAEKAAANERLRAELAERQRLISKLEEAQSQLFQSEKLASIGQLAAGVAHEINNPIGFVTSNLNSLARYLQDLLHLLDRYQEAEPALAASPSDLQAIGTLKEKIEFAYLREDVRALLAESKDGLDRVKCIVQDLKDFSRVDNSPGWQSADLHRCLDSTLNVATNEIKHKAEVVKRYGELPEVECLPSQLNQVFLNLMVNAAHAIVGRGTITLSSGREGGWVWVAVADTGGGIAPEHLKRIFDPFFTTKPVGIGTGLGLSVSYTIVARHGGRLEVESELGKGSVFRIWLPITQSEAAAAPKAGGAGA